MGLDKNIIQGNVWFLFFENKITWRPKKTLHLKKKKSFQRTWFQKLFLRTISKNRNPTTDPDGEHLWFHFHFFCS